MQRIRYEWVLVAVLAVFHLHQARRAIESLSPTYDEPFHVSAGYVMWRFADYRYQGMWHPPLIELAAAVPSAGALRDAPPAVDRQSSDYVGAENYAVADRFLYRSGISADFLLWSARITCWLLFFPLLAWAVHRIAEELATGAGPWALALVLVEPNLLALSTLASTDFGACALLVVSLLLFGRAIRSPTRGAMTLAGVAIGASLLSRYANVTSFGAMGVMTLAGGRAVLSNSALWRRLPFALLGLAAMFAITYQFQSPEIYAAGLMQIFRQLSRGRSAFFHGSHSTTGFLGYFPAVLALKMTIPALILTALGLVALSRDYRRGSDRVLLAMVVAMPAIQLATAATSRVQLGLRYVISVLPFAVVIGARGARGLAARGGRAAATALGLVVLSGLSVWRVSPWFIAYFNEFVGGTAKSYDWFTDSNNDWGQGLRALSSFLEQQGVRSIYLSYFGVGDPRHYGIRYVPVAMIGNVKREGDSDADPTGERRVYLAISGTNLQSTYYGALDLFSWIRGREPAALVGGSIFVYDITDDAGARRILAMLLERSTRHDQAAKLLAGLPSPGTTP